MPRRTIGSDHIANPESLMPQMLRDYIEGNLDQTRFLFRATVVQVDQVGGQIELTPENPRNTIRARIITNGYNATTLDDDLPIFWPMFPHLQMPIKENEMVYVVFEDPGRTHGLWLTRIPTPADLDSKNFVKGSKPYQESEVNGLGEISADKAVAGTSEEPTAVDTDPDFAIEDVPDFTARVGDHVIHGSNNTIVVFGRDRPGDVDSGEAGPGAGVIDIVAGRQSEDMSDADESRVLVARKSDVDTNMDVGAVGAPGTSGVGPVATIGLKSDQIRVVARQGMKVVVTGGDLVLEGANIIIGDQATEKAVLGTTLKSLLSSLIDAIENIVVNTPAGPSAPPVVNQAQFEAIKNQLDTALSNTVVVKG